MFVHRLKLRPPQLSSKWIARPLLEKRVTAASVVAIVAGPGYGKTGLAARVYHAFAGPKIWYGLDRGDADLSVFAAHVQTAIAALGRAGDAASDASWRTGSARETGSRFAEALADFEALVVLDDVHMVEGSVSAAALAEFVERSARAGTRVVLTGRALPLELQAVVPRLSIAIVGTSDLRFNDEQALDFFAADDARALETRTRLIGRAEGWPAGLTLIANAPASRAGVPSGATADETRAMLFGYLATEALEHLSDRERAFLFATALLDELEVRVCDAVTGGDDARDVLSSLARRGLFIVRRTDEAFTAHQLFREFLREELIRTKSRAEVADLHRRAARALAAEGDNVAEIRHLIDAGELESAAVRLEADAFGLLASGQLSRVESLLARLPAARIDGSSTLLAARGRVEQLRGDWDRALVSLRRAIERARREREPDTMAEAVRVASTILASRGEAEQLRALLDETLALEGLSEGSRTALSMTLGAVQLEAGSFDEALATFAAIMPALVARGDLGLQGMVLHNTACAHARRGEPYAALAMYDRALRVKRSAGQRVSTLLTLGNQIFMLRVVGDLDEAERLMHLMLEESYDIGNASMIAHAHENEGAIRLARGDPHGALRAYRAGQSSSDPGDVMFLPDIVHGIARSLAVLDEFVEADAMARLAADTMREAGRLQPLSEVLVTRATCAAELGEPLRALEFAREALELVDTGSDAVVCASVRIDAGAVLLAISGRLDTEHANETRALAERAARNAFALVHERDYRFLLREKATACATLRAQLAPREAAEAPSEPLRVEMLGGLRVFVSGAPLPADAWKRRRARDLFAYLVSTRGRPAPRARLIDLFWPDADADSAHETLRVTISAIRKAVGDVVKFEANAYRFVAPAGTVVDVVLFEERLERARQAASAADGDAARTAYVEAVELYGGDFLDGFDDGDWQWRERERLRAAAAEALRRLAHDARSDPALRRLALDRLLEIAPYDTEAVRRRLDSLVDEGRAGDAEREYEAWCRRYRSVVGSEPPTLWSVPA